MGILRLRVAVFVGTVVIALPGVAHTYADTVTVEGMVYDEASQRLTDVTITATNIETSFARAANSDARGYFHLGELPLGMYRFHIVASDGTPLLDQSYLIGEHITNGEQVEQLIVRLGAGINSMGLPSATKVKLPRLTGKSRRPDPSPTPRNANFILGTRRFDEDLHPLDHQLVLGINGSVTRPLWPVSVLMGLHVSSKDKKESSPGVKAELELSTVEVSLGVGKIWEKSRRLRPFIGGGLALIDAELKGSLTVSSPIPIDFDVDVDDTSLGLFLDLGIFWRLGERFNLGFSYRILGFTELELGDGETDIDYQQLGLIVGWGW